MNLEHKYTSDVRTYIYFQIDDRMAKRKRISTGSADGYATTVSQETFENMSTDGKLSILFGMMSESHVNQARTSASIQNINSFIVNTCQKVNTVEKRVNTHSDQIKVLSYRSLDLEAGSRRNNLIFWGLTENTQRRCDALILSFKVHEMGVDTSEIVIERAHRLGSIRQPARQAGQDPRRPIIAKFNDYRDTEHILDRSYKLKGTKFRVDRDYPREIVEARKRLQFCEKTEQARRRGSRIQVKYPARLFIDGQLVIDEFPEWFDCMKVNRIDGTDMNKTVLQNKNSQPNYSVGMPNQPRDIPRNQDSNGHQILETGRTQYTTIVNKSRDHNNMNMNIHEKGETTSLFSVESLLRDTDSVKESGSTNRHEQEKSVRIVTGPDTEQNNNSRPTVHTSSKNVESNLPRESENSSNIPVAQCELVNSQSNINTNTRIEALPPSFTTQSDRNRTKNKSQQNTLGMPSPRTNHALTDEGNPTVANRGRSFVRYTDSVQSRCRSLSLGRQYVNSVQNMGDFMAANRNTTDASKNSKLNKDTRTDISTEKRNETYSFKQPQRDRLNDPDTVK